MGEVVGGGEGRLRPLGGGAGARSADDARKTRDEGKEDEAIALYRAIRKARRRHPGACRDLGEILNARAWDLAVKGEDLPKALEWPGSRWRRPPTSQNIDSLAVLLFLNDRKAEAEADS